jgi:phospholipid/cholesterol/gamma-HCH transport system substrate-binding protein
LPFASSEKVRVEFAQVPGVNPAAASPVTMAGVDVGTITDAEVTDHGTAVLTLKLDGHPTIYTNAHAVLRPKNPLNEMSVELNAGGPPAGPLAPDAVIPVSQTERPIQADEALQHLDSRSQAALTDLLVQSDVALAKAPQDFAPGLNETTNTVTALRPVVEALRTRREKISQLVTAISQIATALGQNTDRTARLADSTQATLGVLATNDAALRDSLAQLPGLSGSLRAALTNTQDMTKELNPTLDDLNRASEDLPHALHRVRELTGPLRDTVDAAGPMVHAARPVIRDLRPLVHDAEQSLDDIRPVTRDFRKNTNLIVHYLTEVTAFMYNTQSVFATGDANGGVIRGHVIIPPGGGVFYQHNVFVPDQKKINPRQGATGPGRALQGVGTNGAADFVGGK